MLSCSRLPLSRKINWNAKKTRSASRYHHSREQLHIWLWKNSNGASLTHSKLPTLARYTCNFAKFELYWLGLHRISQRTTTEGAIMEIVVCCCLKCKMELGRFRNSWNGIGNTYFSPVYPILTYDDGFDGTGDIHQAAAGSQIENRYVAKVTTYALRIKC